MHHDLAELASMRQRQRARCLEALAYTGWTWTWFFWQFRSGTAAWTQAFFGLVCALFTGLVWNWVFTHDRLIRETEAAVAERDAAELES